jgi:CheY-like chemotaxis protein
MVRILVVDDDQSLRCLLRDMVEPEGYEVVEAANGQEGLRRYQHAPAELVMVDMQMPVMDGLALLRELQRAFPAVKVLAMSGSRTRLQRASPWTRYTLEKPFSLASVRAVVSGTLQDGTGDKAL